MARFSTIHFMPPQLSCHPANLRPLPPLCYPSICHPSIRDPSFPLRTVCNSQVIIIIPCIFHNTGITRQAHTHYIIRITASMRSFKYTLMHSCTQLSSGFDESICASSVKDFYSKTLHLSDLSVCCYAGSVHRSKKR